MKVLRKLFLFFIMMSPLCSIASIVEYDSLCNINKNNINKLVGQVLYYPKSKYIWSNLFWKNKSGKIYKYDKNNSRLLGGKYSKDDEVLGEKFLVKEITYEGEYPLLECRKLSNDDIVYINCFFIDNAYPPFYVEGFYEKMKSLYVNKTLYVHKADMDKYGLTYFKSDIENNQEIIDVKCKSINIGVMKYGVFAYLKAIGNNSGNDYEIFCDKGFLLSKACVDSIRGAYANMMELKLVERALQQKKIQEEINDKLKNYIYDNKGDRKIWRYISRSSSDMERFEPYIIVKIEKCINSNNRYDIEFNKKDNSDKVIVTTFLNDKSQLLFLENNCSTDDYKKLYPKVKNWNAIKNRNVLIGMTPQEVELAWGRPKNINVSEGIWGVHEQWVYDDEYVYFENGKVSAIQY